MAIPGEDSITPRRVGDLALRAHRERTVTLTRCSAESSTIGMVTRVELQHQYAQQKARIDEVVPEFVSNHDIVQYPDGREFSYTTWPEGVDALLADAELIGFTGLADGRRWSLMVPTAAVVAVTPPLVQSAEGLAPRRYRTLRFPTPDELRRLAAVSVR